MCGTRSPFRHGRGQDEHGESARVPPPVPKDDHEHELLRVRSLRRMGFLSVRRKQGSALSLRIFGPTHPRLSPLRGRGKGGQGARNLPL